MDYNLNLQLLSLEQLKNTITFNYINKNPNNFLFLEQKERNQQQLDKTFTCYLT